MDGYIVEIIIGLVALINTWLAMNNRRDQQRFSLRMAEIETRATEAKQDGENVGNALAMATAVVSTFQPVQTLLEKMIATVDSKHDETQKLVIGTANEQRLAHQIHLERIDSAAKMMSGVTERRDEQYEALMAEIQPVRTSLNDLSRQITVATDENTLRHLMAKTVLMVSELSNKLDRPENAPDTPKTESQQDTPVKETELS